MKRGIIMLEAAVRVTIAVVGIFVVAAILYKVYDTFAYSDAEKRFEKLIEVVKQLPEGEYRSFRASLDEDMAIVGFTKESKRIEFKFGNDYNKIPIILSRPAGCPEGSACICLCSSFDYYPMPSLNQGESTGVASCSARFSCQTIGGSDLRQQYDAKNFLFREWAGADARKTYLMKEGFILARIESPKTGPFPSVQGRFTLISIERKKNMINICEGERSCSEVTS